MRALLLAGGLGTRLRPLTNYLPKCLVPIHGRPLLDFWLDALLNRGVSELLVNTHHLAPLVVEYLTRHNLSPRITIVHEEKLLGTGGTILKNRAFFQDEAFLVAHADNLTVFDMLHFADAHARRPGGTEMTMMVFKSPDPHSCGIVELDPNRVVTRFHEKVTSPPGDIANAAVYMLEPSVCALMAGLGKAEIDFSTEVIPRLVGRIWTYFNSSYHRDIGTIASWREAHRDFTPVPATLENAEAWAAVLAEVDEKFVTTAAQILADVDGL